MTPREALAVGRGRLALLEHPAREARLLLAHAVGLTPERLLLLDRVDEAGAARYRALLEGRAAGRPLARILGHREFWNHRFEIGDAVLDPRAETETLVERALDLPWRRVLDLGTGSGCILLSLLADRQETTGMGTDISASALEIAQRNARSLKVQDRVNWRRADWFDGIAERFDLIVSNPPYIAEAEVDGLSPEVRDHDPREALTDDACGLSAYRIIAAGAGAHLTTGGRLMVEIGWRQRDAVCDIFADHGLRDIVCHPDLEGRDRVISARND